MQTVTLNNGVIMPIIGFGVFQIPADEAAEAVYEAIKTGYRLIDTAQIYGNEKETGEGIARAIAEGIVTRDELFVTTKLFINETPEERAAMTIDNSLADMGLDYIDLYLVHQPYYDSYGAWRALTAAYKAGKVRAIGVSNFNAGKLVEFSTFNEVVPAVNQIELNPFYQREEDQEWHNKYGVIVEAWAPFAQAKRGIFEEPTLVRIAEKYHKTVAQVIGRWLVQRGIVVIAKTVHPERMAENINVFNFELDADDLEAIRAIDHHESAAGDHYLPQRVENFVSRFLKK